ncbi:MAG: TetR/AcrR family transcriptional regulator [Candidatus Nanopelagicales bacterium]|jgi:AcrR family transcriptional regulator|nr:TetR/AcrR family transcriptional regulator [Candidatus Nanopelagicales bacterium]
MAVTDRAPARRPQEGRRTELIEAASRVIAREGIHRATTRRIAEEAGVPTGLVHYWFAGKEELIEAVISNTLSPVEIAVAGAGEADGAADLLSRLRAVLGYLQSDDRGREIAMYEMTTFALRRPELTHVAQRQYAAYREIAAGAAVELASAHGATLPAAPSVLGTLVAALVDGLFLAWLADPQGTDVDATLQLLDALLAPHLAGSASTPPPA